MVEWGGWSMERMLDEWERAEVVKLDSRQEGVWKDTRGWLSGSWKIDE